MHKIIEKRDNTYNLNDVLGPPPKGLSYYGSSLIFIIVLLLILISSIVKYPETVKSEVYLTSENPPRKIISPTNAYIDSIGCRDGEFVNKNKVIMTFLSGSKKEDVEWLEENVLNKKYTYFLSDETIYFPELEVGKLQSNYDDLKKKYENYTNLLNTSNYLVQQKSLSTQIEICKQKRIQIKQNVNLLKKKASLSKKIISTDSILNRQGYLANMSYHEQQIKDIDNGFELNQEIKELYEVDYKIQELNQKLNQFKELFIEEKRISISKLKIAYNQMVTSSVNWHDQFTVKSIISGTVHYNNKNWVKGTFIEKGDELLKITPSTIGRTIGYAKISDKGSSNVKKGQRVNIKLNNYPYKEYGILVGKIDHVIETPSSDHYLVHITFPNKIKTSYGKLIEIKPQMKGEADILTKEQSLLTKIFQEIKAIIVN